MLTNIAVGIAALLVAIPVIAVAILYRSDIPVSQLEAKYMSDYSRYVVMEDGLKVHIRDQGNRDGPVLVMIHGLSASLHTWEPWIQRLKSDYRVISIDLAGHGLTGPNPSHDYSMSAQAALVNEVLEQVGAQRYSIIGSSMGGFVAWRHTLDYADKVQKLVLIGASGYPRANTDPGLIWKLLQTPGLNKILNKATPRSFVEPMVRSTYGNSPVVDDVLIDRYWELARREGNRNAATILLTAGDIPDQHLELKHLDKPAFVMWGANDPLVPVEDAHKFHRDLPSSTLVIYEDLAHIPFEEDPDRTLADLRRFLEN